MSSDGDVRKKLIGEYGGSESNTGSTEVQIALLTDRIETLTKHFKSAPKDKHSKRGMMRIINRRKSLLAYLKRKNYDSYTGLIERLGIRK